MALANPARPWTDSLDAVSDLLRTGAFDSDDYRLYRDDDEFVLTLEMPGFDVEDIDLAWDDGTLNVAAERTGDDRRRTFHRRFRFPKEVDEGAIAAEYTNGVLEVTLPIEEGAAVSGTTIPIES